MEGADPVEIELISHEERPKRRGRRGDRRRAEVPDLRSAPAGVPPQPGEPPPWRSGDGTDGGAEVPAGDDPSMTERTRLVTTALVVGVVALLLGWMLGRSGDDGSADGVAAETEATAEDEGPEFPITGDSVARPGFGADDEPGDDTVGSSRDTASVGSRPTGTVQNLTVEPAELTMEPIGVDPRLSGLPIRLVGVEAGGSLVEVDLATGTLTDFATGRFAANGPGLVVGADWVVLGGQNESARVVLSDGSDSLLPLGAAWQPLNVPGTDTFWRVSFFDPSSGATDLQLVGLDGEEIGPAIELPRDVWPLGVDPKTGGLLTVASGRSYAFTENGIEHFGTGQVIAVGVDTVVFHDCGEEFDCRLEVLDRSSGERATVARVADWEDGAELEWGYYPAAPSTSMSPDGSWVPLLLSAEDGPPSIGLVEVDSGRLVELLADFQGWPLVVAWSPDSRYVFTIENLTVNVYDTVTDESFPVFTDSVRWSQIGVRPVYLKDFSPAEETVDP